MAKAVCALRGEGISGDVVLEQVRLAPPSFHIARHVCSHTLHNTLAGCTTHWRVSHPQRTCCCHHCVP